MEEKILTAKQVKALTDLSSSSMRRLEADGRFPLRIKLSQRKIGWLYGEIQEWIKTRHRPGIEGVQ